MDQVQRVGKAALPLRRRGVWLGLVVIVAGLVGMSSLTLGRDQAPGARKEPAPTSSLAAAEMILRGPDQAVAGQRFTLEVLIVNSGATALKDLEIVARMDAHLEQESKEREHREAIDAIAPDDLHIVRLLLTPRKTGPAGVDITLRAKNGAKEEIRHVLPVASADPSARPPERPDNGSPLQFKITPLKKCFADRPCTLLIHVLNTDSKAMEKKLDLVVSYGTPTKGPFAGPILHSGPGPVNIKMRMGMPAPVSSNPVRQAELSIPALAAGEGRTIPIRITPRRIGEMNIAITPKFVGKDPAPAKMPASTKLQVNFDPSLPIERLLPIRAAVNLQPRLPQKLADVPEVALEDPCDKPVPADEAFEHVAHLIEKINHVNTKKTDAFMEALAGKRSDVQGLPLIMGDACRLSPERGRNFAAELNTLRQAMTNPAAMASQLPNPAGQQALDEAIKARIAALVQVVGPEGAQLGRQMVKYLATIAHVDATRALAKLAVFAQEEQVRGDAVAALATRRDKDYNDILLAGLNYPWPAVAQRAADAIVKLKRADLAPQLVAMLERPDPRAPQAQDQDGKKVTVVRELVRINHLRNCLLCHSPASPAAAPGNVAPQVGLEEAGEVKGGLAARVGMALAGPLTAPVPLPGQQLPTPSPQSGYGQFTVPDTLLAFDVTYLRQDFSVKLPVAKAQPWPEMQRFDFLVRAREVSEKEAQAYRDLLRPVEGDLSPYQRTAVASLRQLTGQEAEPNAAAWRRVLNQDKGEK